MLWWAMIIGFAAAVGLVGAVTAIGLMLDAIETRRWQERRSDFDQWETEMRSPESWRSR